MRGEETKASEEIKVYTIEGGTKNRDRYEVKHYASYSKNRAIEFFLNNVEFEVDYIDVELKTKGYEKE